MPEGPEAWNIAKQLKPKLVGQSIIDFEHHGDGNQKKLHGFNKITFPIKIIDVYSVGKRPVIKTDKGWIVSFLGMTGRWLVEIKAHTRLTLVLGSISKESQTGQPILEVDFELYFDDSRCFGFHDFIPDQVSYDSFFSGFGYDLLTYEPNPKEWLNIFRSEKKQTMEVCAFLLMPKYNCTIGNYLCSEILYYAKIRPGRQISSLTNEEIEKLRRVSVDLCRHSAQMGGLTINDYLTPDGKKGGYQNVCYKCQTDPLGYQVVKNKYSDGRTKFWVPEIQI